MDKVAVHLYCCPGIQHQSLEPILCGIEEEGLPFVINDVAETDPRLAGSDAAKNSSLDVGIGIGVDRVTVHYEKTNTHPLFSEQWGNHHALQRIGVNSARLVKRIPVLFPDDQ